VPVDDGGCPPQEDSSLVIDDEKESAIDESKRKKATRAVAEDKRRGETDAARPTARQRQLHTTSDSVPIEWLSASVLPNCTCHFLKLIKRL